MQPILDKYSSVYFNDSAYSALYELLTGSGLSKIFVLVDENTKEHCLNVFLNKSGVDRNIQTIEIPAGEQFKNIETCELVWRNLSNLGADRKSLLINLGGGVLTDLGGFVASTFKRGMRFVNIPTSLLAMVDASVGGKTGVDLGPLKNQIGLICMPELVLIDSHYLKTLDDLQFRSGMAEMYKHGLIADASYWKKMKACPGKSDKGLNQLIYDSVKIKQQIVLEDPNEEGLRKALNFGHTLGHAIESFCLESDNRTDLLHGEAIAAGMILESYLSMAKLGMPESSLAEIKLVLTDTYGIHRFNELEIKAIIDLLKHDKKNSYGNINFTLLKDVGEAVLDCQAENDLIFDAFAYYQG